ncbi:uncharacterized protein LOC122379656 [Amphibalanus amphitrite]|uniref:uncharacterized protein LOC122379656 n=1 Tax=Amphibalanus amphitrite TaxID=1232801 RepID=UPI001C9051BB|nr:uncharacterized protein LOC122379656 [Amphibalanus amphitrite]
MYEAVCTSDTGHQGALAGDRQTVTCFSQNVRSIKNKLGTLRAHSPVFERFDILALTETWLKPYVGDSELQHGLSSHVWFRRDREESVGGGVACAVRAALQPLRRAEVEQGEVLVVDLVGLRPAVTVIVGYRPPDDDAAVTSIVNVLETVCSAGRSVIMLGDYNLPEIVWHGPDRPPQLLRRSARATTFLDAVDQHGLRQHVLQPTRENSTLDLVLTNISGVQCDSDVGYFDSDHNQVTATFTVPRTGCARVTRSTALNYRRADFDGLRHALRLLPWNMLDDLAVDDAVELFYEWTDAAISDHIPVVTLKARYPPWFDADVKRALRQKEIAHRHKKQSPTDERIKRFATCRTQFKSLVLSKYRRYMLHIVDDFKNNSKRFWSLLKSVKSSKNVSVLKCDGTL